MVKYYGIAASSTRTQRFPSPTTGRPEPAAASQLVPLVRHRIIIEVPDCSGDEP